MPARLSSEDLSPSMGEQGAGNPLSAWNPLNFRRASASTNLQQEPHFPAVASGLPNSLGTTAGYALFGTWSGSIGIENAATRPAPSSGYSQEGFRQKQESAKPTFRGRVSGPVRSLLGIFERWQLTDQDAAVLLGIDQVQFVADLRVGTMGLAGKDMQDRARLLLRIYEGAHSLLRHPEAERSWINSKLPSLDNRSVVDVMRRGSIADLTFVLAFIDHANGR